MLVVNIANFIHDFWFTSFLKLVSLSQVEHIQWVQLKAGGKVKDGSSCKSRNFLRWQFLKKWKIELPCDSVILLLSIYPTGLKARTQADTYRLMFKAALFTIAKRWKQLKYPSADKQNVIYPWVGYHSALKGRKFWHMLQHRWAWKILC